MLHLECNRHKVPKDPNAVTDGDGTVKSDMFFALNS